MNRTIKSGFKIYLFFILYVFLSAFIYALCLKMMQKDYSLIGKLIVSGIGFLGIGFAYGNAIQRKGLWIGLLVGILHFFAIKLILFLAIQEFSFSVLLFFIDTILAGAGGLIGMNMKKLF
ncbi:MAG: hypothetical protein K2I77_00240 [Anaeroplasmataceae bacterium]|nr:hypothetical protein [Anaeroplasmataceae bacterium]